MSSSNAHIMLVRMMLFRLGEIFMRQGNQHRPAKVPARKLPGNKALAELVSAAQDLLALGTQDIDPPTFRAAHRKLEDSLGPFNRTANELG